MFSAFFIKRPIFAAVISIIIVILGGVAYFALPISRYPEISPPTVTVSAVYPGANAETVAETDKPHRINEIMRRTSTVTFNKRSMCLAPFRNLVLSSSISCVCPVFSST